MHLVGCQRLQKFVCTTCDIWSSNRRSFFGITCHWLNENLEQETVVLCCKRFAEKHTYNKIADLMCGVQMEFDLDPHKILATVTDNATNFVKCFMEYARVVNSNSSDTEIRDIESQTIEIELSSHVRCASHTLSLIITSAIEKCLKFKGRGGGGAKLKI